MKPISLPERIVGVGFLSGAGLMLLSPSAAALDLIAVANLFMMLGSVTASLFGAIGMFCLAGRLVAGAK